MSLFLTIVIGNRPLWAYEGISNIEPMNVEPAFQGTQAGVEVILIPSFLWIIIDCNYDCRKTPFLRGFRGFGYRLLNQHTQLTPGPSLPKRGEERLILIPSFL